MTQRPLQARATLRLALVLALAVTLLSLAGMALQYRLVAARLMDGQRALLQADLDGFATLYAQRRIIALRQAIEDRAAADGTARFLLLDRRGTKLAGEGPWPEGLPLAEAGFSAGDAVVFRLRQGRMLGVARALPGGFALLAARSLAGTDATLAALRRGIVGLGLLLLAAGAGVGWIAARGVMARIGRLNALADRVAAGDLDARLPGARSADEFGLLETHVHAMLDRIGALNRATHRLSDTIAHELRTPLNRMLQTLVQIEGQQALTDDLRAQMRATLRTFDALLDISRAEADQGHRAGLLPVDLSALCGQIWELYEPLAEERGLVCRAAITPGLQVLGDRTLIGQALANLLENATKFCAPGDALTLTLAPEGDLHAMTVADTGPGLPPDLADVAFDRFTRGARDLGTPGHGLGLTLVQAIAARHGARVTRPVTERGFVLCIGWPRLPVPAA